MRWSILMIVATAALADTRQELIDVLASMASALSEGNPAVFLRAIDPSAPGYAELARNVNALANQNELTCSIEISKQEGDDHSQTVELDWLLEIRGKDQSPVFLRRQAMVKCRLERRKNKWRVISLDPARFFAPPGTGSEK
jgi:murein L,D-transpeptidase YcbB/YkuD